MKLKKIASLMLAGIMAVSMLAGCKDNTINNTPVTPDAPTTTNVVSAVEAGIKSWNSDLEISVKSSANMDDAIKKLFDLDGNLKITKENIVTTLNYVFGLGGTGMIYENSDFVYNEGVVSVLNNKNGTWTYEDGDRAYTCAIVETTATAYDTYAGDMIGDALQKLENTVAAAGAVDAQRYDYLDVDYTLYVTHESAVMANNSVKNYVIAVLQADYSAVTGK